jgi:hypothetical protein
LKALLSSTVLAQVLPVADLREAFQKGQLGLTEAIEVESSPPDFYVDTTGQDVAETVDRFECVLS